PCPDCGHEISELAPSCIHCGRPMRPGDASPSAQTAGQPEVAAVTPAPAADAPPPAWSRRAREMAAAAPADLPKPVAGIATVLVIGGAGLVWSMMPAHPRNPDSVGASLGVVSRGINMLGNSAAIIGALMAAMNHRAGHRVVRVAGWIMVPLLLLFILIGWVMINDSPEVSTAERSAIVAGAMGLLAVVAVAPWLLFIYLFRKSRYG
ncbi:MAG TPA: hypothetical protein VFH27_17345, partial [Longimicrobiaceae bacterium]|nr:hypothetical protein [Longimicrobiaceae bacterium]